MPGFRNDLATRFWSKVRIGQPDECWEWQGGLTGKGYPKIRGDGGRKGKQMMGHRVAVAIALEMEEGELGGLDVHHLCFNRRCVNPRHLSDLRGDLHDDLHAEMRTNPEVKLAALFHSMAARSW